MLLTWALTFHIIDRAIGPSLAALIEGKMDWYIFLGTASSFELSSLLN